MTRQAIRRRSPGQRRRATVGATAALIASVIVPPEAFADRGDTAVRGAAGAPNIVLITIDTLRLDHCSLDGYEHNTTPALKRIAAEGALFDTAYAPTSETAPTHATIFTGLYPGAHLLVKNGLSLGAHNETLAEILTARGYQTAGFVSSFVLNRSFGWNQGFALYRDDFTAAESSIDREIWEGQAVPGQAFDQRADVTTRRAIRWLWKRDRARPFFLFVHYFDPHHPYAPPDDFATRFPMPKPDAAGGTRATLTYRTLIRNYDGEIAFADQEVGRLVDAIDKEGLAETTLLVITADHGEGLMDHGYMLHGVNIYEEAVRVPLLMRWPGRIAAGQRYPEPVALVDLAPTILEFVGAASADHRFQGRSLAPALRGQASLDPERPVYLHRRPYVNSNASGVHVDGEQFGIRLGRWKYIVGEKEGRRELFDLAQDAGELRNRANTDSARAELLAGRLEAWKRAQVLDAPLPSVRPEDLKALEALGYLE